MYLFISTILSIIYLIESSKISPYELISSTGWVIDTDSFYPDFSASLTADQRPTIFQYFYNNSPALFECSSKSCSDISTISMPGLFSAQFALGGISPRRIQQYSPKIIGTQFFLSVGYATPNRDVEMVMCLPSDSHCDKPIIENTVDSPGFGTAGLRLTFTKKGIPIMIIPQARYASRDNRVTGYTVQSCQDPSCEHGLGYSSVSLPFNLTGNAYCEGTCVDVALNQYGFPTWLTLCGPELNLIHCLTESCNQTSVTQFNVNYNLVYFAYLSVDSQFRFSISTNGQQPKSDITYIKCLNPDCTQSTEYQYTLPPIIEIKGKLVGVRVQHVIDLKTDLPVFHFLASEYPSDKSFYMFIVCENIECSNTTNVINYGDRLGVNNLRVTDVFVDDQGIIIASSRVNYTKTNETINLIVRIGRTEEKPINQITFVQP